MLDACNMTLQRYYAGAPGVNTLPNYCDTLTGCPEPFAEFAAATSSHASGVTPKTSTCPCTARATTGMPCGLLGAKSPGTRFSRRLRARSRRMLEARGGRPRDRTFRILGVGRGSAVRRIVRSKGAPRAPSTDPLRRPTSSSNGRGGSRRATTANRRPAVDEEGQSTKKGS
jgi:hypothetical protein